MSMRFDPRRLSYVVRVDIQCPVRVFSLHSHEKEKREIAVEKLVSGILLEIFWSVEVYERGWTSGSQGEEGGCSAMV